jgi:hypothetical protein
MYRKIKLIIPLFFIFTFSHASYATVYFSWDAENQTCGANAPNPPFWIQSMRYAQIVCDSTAPQGSKYFQWHVPGPAGTWDSAYTEVGAGGQGMPATSILGKTIYFAYYFNQTRVGGVDIWHRTASSGDKGNEIDGVSWGVRWLVSKGHWGPFADNQPGRYTVWLGNPTFHINSGLEVSDILPPNQNGYSFSNPIQLEYEKWYSVVMYIKMATDSTGIAGFYVNGLKVSEFTNIQTVATGYTPQIEMIEMMGTLAQGAYDAPEHYQKYDALLLTDNLQDVINGGYLQKIPSPPILLTPVK